MQVQTQKSINIPSGTLDLLMKELKIREEDVGSFLAGVIDKIISEHIQKTNSEVFSGDEIKEIEDNLKGLGYI